MEGKKRGGAGRGQGRPLGTTKPDRKETLSIRLTPEQRAKLKALGGANWVRKKIDEASL